MANQLGRAQKHSLITLWKRGWSHRRIAQTLGIYRETVSQYVRLAAEATADAADTSVCDRPPGVFRPLEPDGCDAAERAKPGSRIGD